MTTGRILAYFFGLLMGLLMGLLVLVLASITAQRTGNEMIWQAGLWFGGVVCGYLIAMFDAIMKEGA